MPFGSDFSSSLAAGVKSALCGVLQTVDLLADASPFSSLPPGGGAADAARGAINAAVCNAPPPPKFPPGFDGGQCQCERYLVPINATNNIGQNFTPLTVLDVWGAVQGVSYEVQGVDGVISLRCGGGTGGACVPGSIVTVSTSGDLTSVTIGTITRPGGEPDPCGNPPDAYVPPNANNTSVDVDIEYTNDIDIDVTAPVNIVFAVPIVNINGEVNFPFTINVSPDLSFTGIVNQNGDVNISFGDPRTPDRPGDKDPQKGCCNDPGAPVSEPPEFPPDTPDPPVEPEPPESTDTIIGVLVTVTSIAPNKSTVIFQSDNPDIYAPNLGFVSFFCRSGAVAGGWTTDIPVKNRRQLIECPWPGGAIRVAGTPQPGITWTLTAIRAQTEVPVLYY